MISKQSRVNVNFDDETQTIIQMQVEAEHEARSVTNRQGGGALYKMDVVQIITATAESSMNPVENNANFCHFPEVARNDFLDFKQEISSICHHT